MAEARGLRQERRHARGDWQRRRDGDRAARFADREGAARSGRSTELGADDAGLRDGSAAQGRVLEPRAADAGAARSRGRARVAVLLSWLAPRKRIRYVP